MDQRFKTLRKWLENELNWQLLDLQPASNDASFRRYFRASLEHTSFVLMDAPPEQEPLEPFVSIARQLKTQGVNSPQVYEVNPELGYLVLEDLGTVTYLQALLSNKEQAYADQLYHDALQSLIHIQQGSVQANPLNLADYDESHLDTELELFTRWYLGEHLQQELTPQQLDVWQQTKRILIDTCQQQPQVWVHRDYHLRNLMLTSENSPGVIDFQDMVIGPISYDLVSLLKDCYIEWPREQQLEWLHDYYQMLQQSSQKSEFSFEQLVRWYDLVGMQRHLKVLGIFCRLNYRDGKQQYVNDLPLVKKYLDEALDLYPEFSEFQSLFNRLHD